MKVTASNPSPLASFCSYISGHAVRCTLQLYKKRCHHRRFVNEANDSKEDDAVFRPANNGV